jgi:inner membrane protein
MDSLSQIVLGAAVGEAVLGRKIGNKAIYLGALAGTVPDLDVLSSIFNNDEIFKLLNHRSNSHAIFYQIIYSIPFAVLFYVFFKKRISLTSWYLFWFLGFLTHTLLDCFTTYGTQLLLPFSNYLVGFNNISVVDPFYTIPFLIFVVACLFIDYKNPIRLKVITIGFIVSCSYLMFTFYNKYQVHQEIKTALNEQKIAYKSISTSPTLFNNFLWSGIIESDSTFLLCEYSTLQKSKQISFYNFPKNLNLEENYKSNALDVLKWFSQGKYILEKQKDTLNFYVIKWGRQDYSKSNYEKSFRFYYKLYRNDKGQIIVKAEQKFKRSELKKAFRQLFNRIFYN